VPHLVREIHADSPDEVEWVARGMRQTLIEVEGEATGTALYTMEWLEQRVRWHLDPTQSTAGVFVAQNAQGQIVGHTIVRAESESGKRYGLISTTYVEPESRKQNIATSLLLRGESWMRDHGLPEAATWTSATNTRLITLYHKHGYAITAHHVHETTKTPMIRLTKLIADQS
jgi:GNAT superfamily N-acetyltransferase